MKSVSNIKILLILFTIFWLSNIYINYAQSTTDSLTRSRGSLRSWILPSALLTSALILNNTAPEKQFQRYVRNITGDAFRIHADDYLQYVPAVQLYGAEYAGFSAENHWFDRTKYLIFSHLITAAITHTLKTFHKVRPDGAPHSFPSGHTSFAFVNAWTLYREYRQGSPVWAYSGMVFATGTGGLRIANNRHWISDVLAGAGIGILVTEAVYRIRPLHSWNPFVNKTNNVYIIPYENAGSYGLIFQYRF